ncbi:hypothetical protein D3C80_2182770 [compost metagenome]
MPREEATANTLLSRIRLQIRVTHQPFQCHQVRHPRHLLAHLHRRKFQAAQRHIHIIELAVELA